MSGTRSAFVIGIETYQNPKINSVEFANNDAKEFSQLLVDYLAVPRENIRLWLDQDATRSNFEHELRYHVNQLGPDDHFYFFYAGHGLFAKGKNRLTTWDTHPFNLPETTVVLDDVLLSALGESKCHHNLMFVDACATDLEEGILGRDIVSEMNKREFEVFIEASEYTAVFFSCSPGEKSYPSLHHKHGIWTHHLISALKGNSPSAISRDRYITAESLQNYLAAAIPKFIREKTTIRGNQRPYSLIGSNGPFAIIRIPEPAKAELSIKPNFSDAYFRSLETRPFRELPGFDRKKRHTVPTSIADRAERWARRLLKDETADEVQSVYEEAKRLLKLRSSQIRTDMDEDGAGGSVDTDAFRFDIEVGQSARDPSDALIKRMIMLRIPHNQLPEEFDEIFPSAVEELVIPIPGSKRNFSVLVDALEELAARIKATVGDNPNKGTIEVKLYNGTSIVFITRDETMIIRFPGISGCLSMIDSLESAELGKMFGTASQMIGHRREMERI